MFVSLRRMQQPLSVCSQQIGPSQHKTTLLCQLLRRLKCHRILRHAPSHRMTLAFINVTASDANTIALARCALQTWFSLTCVHSADLSRFWLLHKLTCDCHKHAHEVESRQARRGRLPLCSFAASADRYSPVLAWYRTILVVVLRFHVSCRHVCHSLLFSKHGDLIAKCSVVDQRASVWYFLC